MKSKRLGRIEYYLKIVEAAALRATCDRGRAGAIIVRDGRILTTGYVGAPLGLPHCDDVGHEFVFKHGPEKVTQHCIRTVHAEMNAILQAAKFGISVNGADLYCTMFPCYSCAQAIINVGIVKVNAIHDYQDSGRSKDIFTKGDVEYCIQDSGCLHY